MIGMPMGSPRRRRPDATDPGARIGARHVTETGYRGARASGMLPSAVAWVHAPDIFAVGIPCFGVARIDPVSGGLIYADVGPSAPPRRFVVDALVEPGPVPPRPESNDIPVAVPSAASRGVYDLGGPLDLRVFHSRTARPAELPQVVCRVVARDSGGS